jgi:uncharacterized membrane protein
MDNIREEIQNWLEDRTREVKGIHPDTKVDWTDIEDIANGDQCMKIKWEKYENRTIHWVHSDAVSIDHMCAEILSGDFTKAMELLKRYRNIVITNDFAKEK